MYNKVAMIQRRGNKYPIEASVKVENEEQIIVELNKKEIVLDKAKRGNDDYILIKVRGGLTYNKKYVSIL